MTRVTAPRLSVVLPVRDGQATLEDAVQSLAVQSMGDFELLLIDDGSRDGTPSLMAALAAADARITCLSTGGAGLVAALNLGLARARAPLVARMDADDVSLPGRFEASLVALQDERLAAVGTGVELVRRDRPVSPNLAAYARWLQRADDAPAPLRGPPGGVTAVPPLGDDAPPGGAGPGRLPG